MTPSLLVASLAEAMKLGRDMSEDSAYVSRQRRHQRNCYSCSKCEMGGCRFPRISLNCLPYAYHQPIWATDFQLIFSKSLNLMVGAHGLEPWTR